MLGILLIYFIGKYFYELAQDYYKQRWLFGILGVVSYYIGTFFGGVILAVLDDVMSLNINWDNNLSLGIMALPFGIAFAYLFYYLLKRHWKKNELVVKEEIDDIGKNFDNFRGFK